MNKDLKLSPKMIHALEVTGLDDIMRGGPTRAALMRRGLVFKREGTGRFGHFTQAGRELAAELQGAKNDAYWEKLADDVRPHLERARKCPAGDSCTRAELPGSAGHKATDPRQWATTGTEYPYRGGTS